MYSALGAPDRLAWQWPTAEGVGDVGGVLGPQETARHQTRSPADSGDGASRRDFLVRKTDAESCAFTDNTCRFSMYEATSASGGPWTFSSANTYQPARPCPCGIRERTNSRLEEANRARMAAGAVQLCKC